MKVVYAKSVGEKIDDAIDEADKKHRRIECIYLNTVERVELYHYLYRDPHAETTLREFMNFKPVHYRGVELRAAEREEHFGDA